MIILNNIFKILFLFLTLFHFLLVSHRNGFDKKILLNFYKQNYGIINSLNSKYYFVNDIFLLTLKYKILDYNIDKELIMHDPAAIQRLIEVTYPSRINYMSNFFFTNNKKYLSEHCNVLDKLNSIILYECK